MTKKGGGIQEGPPVRINYKDAKVAWPNITLFSTLANEMHPYMQGTDYMLGAESKTFSCSTV